MLPFTGIKIFSATKAEDRSALGEVVEKWLRAHPDLEIVDKELRQSSDSAFHCLTLTLFYRSKADPTAKQP
ncbi:MAG: hypothetical protein IT384_05935 [Deltaproteobacteria bacterium]|nr:hypothetical protein [Deltaproteobacteria bacterium]